MSKILFQELNDAQLKIQVLFKDLMLERDELKQKSESVEYLKKRNRELMEDNEKLRKYIIAFFKPFLNEKDSKKPQGLIWENLVEFYSNLWGKVESMLNVKHSNDSDRKPADTGSNTHSEFHNDEDMIKEEIKSLSKLNFSTQFFSDAEFISGHLEETKVESETIKEKFVENVEESEGMEPLFINSLNFVTKNDDLPFPRITGDKSPVFKDVRNKKGDNCEGEASRSSLKLVNEKFLLKKTDVVVSPLKRTSSQTNSPSPKKGGSTPKRSRVKPSLESPKACNPQLKRSNSREAELSPGGVRKLTQTILNINCFKKKLPEQNSEGEKENFSVKVEVHDDGEDDVIMESPKKKDQELEDLSKLKKKSEPTTTLPSTSGIDLDETYVSSTLVKNCKLTGNKDLEKIMEDQTPLKRPTRQKSPEYDSVQFVYKRDAVRKKTDRLKLPGHSCPECNQYYKEAWGDEFSTENLKRHLNKCSRHRDKFSPTHDETPAGYWKPYLTSTGISPSKDDTLIG